MAKMYLFRKLSELSQQQADVCEEAASSVLDDVFKGKASTIFSYGHWPIGERRSSKVDVVDRILCELFGHVCNMEVTMQINISISHMQQHVAKDQLTGTQEEHFVASPHDVYAYIERVIGQLQQQSDDAMPTNDYPYALFTICVRQTNLDQSLHLNGSIQLVHLTAVDQSEMMLQLHTPMASLLRIISALASNTKTHIRYYNIRLTRILKDLLDSDESTVIINYTTAPQFDAITAMDCAKVWKALYLRERNKCHCLSNKLSGLEFWRGSDYKFQLDELLELLKRNNTSIQLEFELPKQRNTYTQCKTNTSPLCQLQRATAFAGEEVMEASRLSDQLRHIKTNAEASLEEMLEVRDIVTQLAISHEQNSEQLKQKNQMLDLLHLRLAKSNRKLQKQRLKFKRKLAKYSNMFQLLWTHQRRAQQVQEQQRQAQLSKVLDDMYLDLHSAQLMESSDSLSER
ncbi:PREDICTED: kinesin heavy chain [Drosophila arizonae]|uniref:Kinesin heavy chain n=1 Tax=Drosophila arizonae TaxID=7263 RepID=A0ABM1NN99_DROAR|nr:PREDICTED: kinesin heavy chain [Drosophila arizonae]